MANALKNSDIVLKRATVAFMNALMLADKVDRQFDKDNVFEGYIGATANVRRPILYTASDGATIQVGDINDIEEAIVPVTLDQRKKVVIQLSCQELAVNIEENGKNHIDPAMEELAQQVESYLAGLYTKVYNFVGTPGTTPSTQAEVNAAKQKLDELGVPMTDRCAFYDPAASNTLASALSAVFPTGISKKAIEQAVVTRYSNFDIYQNQSLKIHTTGAWGASTADVLGASQNVTYASSKDTMTQTLETDQWPNSITGVLKAGDVITIAGVNSVNRRTREDTGNLAQFVVINDADSGATTGPATLTISPPIIIDGPYQTVTAAPANDATITVISGVASTGYRQNMAFHKDAFTLAFGQLKTVDSQGAESSRQNYKGISLRVVSQYDVTSDKVTTRFDVFFGAKAQNPGFAVRTTG